jgi:hypothetical protein
MCLINPITELLETIVAPTTPSLQTRTPTTDVQALLPCATHSAMGNLLPKTDSGRLVVDIFPDETTP